MASQLNDYSAQNIEVLEGLAAVRKRPGMYIGSTGVKGLHHLVWEVVDNSIDEFLAGFGDEIDIVLNPNGSVTVEDRGRGIPIDKHHSNGLPALEIIMTTLHAGGKFDNQSYSFSGGLHGVGVSVVNALSEWLEIKTCWKNKEYIQRYERGKKASPIKKIGKCNITGTSITFMPDSEIFTTTNFNFDTLAHRLQESAFLNKGLTLNLWDKRNSTETEKIETKEDKKVSYSYDGGIKEFIEYLNHRHTNLHDEIVYFEKEKNQFQYEIALQYNQNYNERIYSYANNIKTDEGGYHVTGFKAALTRAINSFAQKNNLLNKNDPTLTGSDLREGLTAVVSVRLAEPQFEGQTKNKLGNSNIKSKIESSYYDFLTLYLNHNPEVGKAIVNKALAAIRARQASKKARELSRKKNSMVNKNLPVKLADCSSRKPEESEIFLVEGDSAGGSAKQGRNRDFQAVLPLKGKILNVERARIDKVLSNDEIISIISALGTGIGEDFDLSKLRYHKIIIMTDADIDGAHIGTLILTLFYRYMEEIIKKDHIYMAQPPLYRVKIGSKSRYLYTEEDLYKFKQKNKEKNFSLQQYKGLGEMNPDQLWKTTMDPENRKLMKIEIDDDLKADDIFTRLMGNDSSLRKEFIFANADKAKDLDI
ncbi:MAG: DNA topoisomerase (ATP-hydrolyzing) subunit B [Bacillota bacterium]